MSGRGQVVLGVDDLDATVDFLVENGFRLAMIMPADDPRVAVVEGFGLTLRLDAAAPVAPGVLRLPVEAPPTPATVAGPGGTTIEFVPATAPLEVPPLRSSFVLTRADEASWTPGRAGMGYRDLIPDRLGGRFVASHIHIPDGGPVADYVHHHHIRFQMLYCYRGWARLVYEDQGEPFRFEAGDCVLQPPHIRHQVLETSSGFDVVEIGCPAEHETLRDHHLRLPTPEPKPDRTFGGQRFVHHRASEGAWGTWRSAGYDARDLGIAGATGGLVGARVVRSAEPGEAAEASHDGELMLWFVLDGGAVIERGVDRHRLGPADSVVLAPGERYRLAGATSDLQFLEVTVPA